MVRADDDSGALPQPPLAQRVEHLAHPVVDHAELRSVVGADVPSLPLAQPSRPDGADVIRGPDEQLALPPRVVAAGPRRGRVEGLVRVELVDEEQEGRVVRRTFAQPARRRLHRLGPRVVRLGAEERPRQVVGTIPRLRPTQAIPPEPPAAPGRKRRRPDEARVGVGPPGIALVPAHVVPGAEVGVVVLAAHLEEVRMVRHQHGRHTGPTEMARDGLLPDLYGPPRSPEEVERAAQDVVARRHAGQRARDVRREADGALAGKPVEVGRVELRAAVAAEQVPVEAVQQEDDGIARPTARRLAPRLPPRPPPAGHRDGAGHAAMVRPRAHQRRPMPSPNRRNSAWPSRGLHDSHAGSFVTLRGLQPRQREEECARCFVSVSSAVPSPSPPCRWRSAAGVRSPAPPSPRRPRWRADLEHHGQHGDDAGEQHPGRRRVLRDLCVLRRGHRHWGRASIPP